MKQTFKQFFENYCNRIFLIESKKEIDEELKQAILDYIQRFPKAIEKSKQFIARCMFELQQELPPIFYTIAKQLRMIPTAEIDTMGVDTCGNLYFNPMFVCEELIKDDDVAILKGVLVHEVMHILDRTHAREIIGREEWVKDPYSNEAQTIHTIGNLAYDLIINRDVLRAGYKLIPDGIIPKFLDEGKTQSQYSFDFTIDEPDIVDIDITRFTGEKAYDMYVWAANQAADKLYAAELVTEDQYNKFKEFLQRVK